MENLLEELSVVEVALDDELFKKANEFSVPSGCGAANFCGGHC